MLHLRVLGAFGLDAGDGSDVPASLRQPKRLALVAFLTLRAPGGFVRRDTVLGTFWPESDDERARGSLRVALHALRRALGPDAVRTRGDGEIGIDPARLRCDAVEFADAVAAGRLDDALALYRGDLLDGLFVADAPAFERWLEEERGRLRRLAADAAKRLVSDAEARGDLAGAVRAAWRGVELAPDDEVAARRLIALLDRAGDRAGAIRAYEELVARLAAELETEPAPETRALVDAIRRRAVAAAAPEETLPPPTPPIAPPIAPLFAPPIAPPIAPPSPPVAAVASARPPRRWSRVPLAIAALLVVVSAGGWLAFQRRGAADTASIDVLAVLPFGYHGSRDLAYLGEGLPRLLSANLNGAGQLRTIDPVALHRAAGDDAPSRVAAAAARLGAGLLVSGQVMESGGRVRIVADVARTGSPARAQIVVDGRGDDLISVVDELTARLVAAWGTERGQRLTSLAARTTRSRDALQAYLDGERAYAAGRYADAVEAFRRAVTADSTFALAYYRLTSALSWTGAPTTFTVATHARRLAGRLSHRDSLLVEARYASEAGQPELAEPLYRQVLAEHPDELEAWLQLGEVQFHWAAMTGRAAVRAESAFARALAIDSSNVPALVHLARIASLGHHPGRVDSLLQRLERLAPAATETREVAALRAFLVGTPSDRAAAIADLVAQRNGRLVRDIVPALAAATENAAAALELLRAADAPDLADVERRFAPLIAAALEVARGRWRAARSAADRARFAAVGLQYRAAFAAAPVLPLGTPELAALRAEIERAPSYAVGEPMSPYTESLSEIHVARRAYLAARLAMRGGDSAAAWRLAASFPPATAADSAFVRRMTGQLRAEWLRRRGDAAGALRALGAPAIPLDARIPALVSFPTADERFLRAELLREAGRDEEALAWYATFPDPTGYDLIYLAPAHLARARIHDRRGERALAAAHYRRFVALWAECDPELRPLVDEARRRLTALGG